MSVYEFILAYWDWYLLAGFFSACRYLPNRFNSQSDIVNLILTFSWDMVTWPSDVLRNLWILKE